VKTDTGEAALLAVIMALVIFFCRACPFLFFRGKKQNNGTSSRTESFIAFVEKIVPPLAMTVLTFNAISASVLESVKQGSPGQAGSVLIAAAFTVIVHIWRKNPLLSIFGGTAMYLVMERLIFL